MINHSWTHECNDWRLQTIAVIPQKKQTPWIACPLGRSSKRAGVLPLSWFCLPIHKKRHGLLKSKSYLQSQVAGNLWNFLFFFFFFYFHTLSIEESILEAGRTDGFKDRKSSCQMLLNIQKKKWFQLDLKIQIISALVKCSFHQNQGPKLIFTCNGIYMN